MSSGTTDNTQAFQILEEQPSLTPEGRKRKSTEAIEEFNRKFGAQFGAQGSAVFVHDTASRTGKKPLTQHYLMSTPPRENSPVTPPCARERAAARDSTRPRKYRVPKPERQNAA